MSELITLQDAPIRARDAFQSDFFARFIEYTDVNNTTMKGYISCLHAFIRWMQDNGITQPQREDIKAYKAYLEAHDYKAGTKAQYLRAVRHFFKWTASENLYPNVADNIKLKGVYTKTHKKDALGREDVPVIAETINRDTETGKRLYAIYMLCITCGLRTVEVSRANIEDIKTKGGKTYLWVYGKGHKEADTPVLLVPEVKEALQEYLDSRKDKYTGKSPLFISTSNRPGHDEHGNTTHRIAPTTISQMIKKALVEAGFDSNRITAHSLRHTSGTGAYKATHSLFEAQQHQRHASPETTEIYIHEEAREERNTEQQVYNYYFRQNEQENPANEAIQIIKNLSPVKLEAALSMLRAMQTTA